MHSSELPTTEWWDPEYDLYDVPGSPYGETVGELAPGMFDAWWTAYSHCWDIRWYRHGSAEYRPDFKGRELTRGVFHPPSWSGHRDACPTQWGGPCDCDLPPRTTPCTCRYRVVAVPLTGVVVMPDPITLELGTVPHVPGVSHLLDLHGVATASVFVINPRCHHHGDRARTYRRPCTCPGLTHNPDCRRHNYNPAEDEPRHHHDDIHNPNDLDEDERHD